MRVISKKASISKFADIEDSVKGSKIIIEEHVTIDAFVKIKPAGGLGDVRIGKNSTINAGVVIYTGNGVVIGEDVLIAANCTLAPVNHAFQCKKTKIVQQGFQKGKGGIVIEDDVWVGANSVILDGAILRKGCVVGANALVNTELAAYSINIGSPTKPVGMRK